MEVKSKMVAQYERKGRLSEGDGYIHVQLGGLCDGIQECRSKTVF
jgi:hypothetical protein